MLVGQVVKTFGALNFMNFEIEKSIRYKFFRLEKMLDMNNLQKEFHSFFLVENYI